MGSLSDDGLSSSSLSCSLWDGCFLNLQSDIEGTQNPEILDFGSKLAYLSAVNL